MTSTSRPEADQLREAEAAYSAGDLETSARLFAPVTRSADRGNAAQAFYGLGMLALATRKPDDASQLFRAATQADANHANSWYQLGCLEESGSPASAVADFQRVLQINPQHAAALRKVGTMVPRTPAPAAQQWRPPEPSPAPQQVRPPEPAPLLQATHSPTTVATSGDPREGVVANFQQRVEQRNRRMVYVWDFRVVRQGLETISVEMRGYRFDGSVTNGDRIRLPRDARPGRVQHLRRVTNLSANAAVRVTRGPRLVFTLFSGVFKIVFILVWLAIASGIIYFALHASHKIQ